MQTEFAAQHGFKVNEQSVGGWSVRWINQPISLPGVAVAQLFDLITRWLWAYAAVEETWVMRRLQVPTLWLKFDCVIDQTSNRLGVYEIDDCPDGVGIGCLVNHAFRQRLEQLRRHWPKFTPLVAAGRTTDDSLWLGESISLETVNGHRGFILARPHELDDDRFGRFARLSVSTCLQQGRKDYGARLGLWESVSSEAELNWHDSFVLKASRGYGGSGVYIRHKGSFRGASGKASIIAALKENNTMYRQPFIMPMACPFDPRYLMVLRPFFGFDLAAGRYQYLGGFWLARPGNLKLHGAADAIVGPLV